jgi:alpha-D-ribose 1-methylphosphonate 5-triphosphate diphosphatase
VVLATHDDRDPDDVDAAGALGACVVEFPLTLAAAHRAKELAMTTVLGAPNAVRGRSTSTGNLLVADAVAAGVCDVLCSDYLPSALQAAPLALEAREVFTLDRAVDLVAAHPAAVLDVIPPTIAVDVPLTATSATRRRRWGVSDVGVRPR